MPPVDRGDRDSTDASLGAFTLDDDALHRAKLFVCDQAGRGLDVADEQQLARAASIAEPVLDMLGPLGDDVWIQSRATAKSRTAPFLHGTEGGVKAHRAAHRPFCGPCQRWVEVQARKRGVIFTQPAKPPLVGLCGTARRWKNHLNAREQLDPACAMYSAWRQSCHAAPNGSGPLSEHLLDEPLPVHLEGTPCAHDVDKAGNGTQDECTGVAGFRQSCSCGWTLLVTTKGGCGLAQQEHRRQVILRAISEAN
jgi:hypothetical protein